MSLANIQSKLSRAEMKNIMAGSGSNECTGLSQAACTRKPCTFSVGGGGGYCGWSNSQGKCYCAGAT